VWRVDPDIRFDELAAALDRSLSTPLPGVDAQLVMSPSPRPGWRPGHLPEDCQRGAALLLVYPSSDDRPCTVLTARARHLERHSGQVSLPGGRIDEGESVEDAALREAEEEIGVDARDIRLVGGLTPLYIPASLFVLYPVVGVTDRRPVFRACDREVAEIIEVPVADLAAPSNVRRETMQRPVGPTEVPYFAVSGHRVWGATAMVLSEFLHVI